ncbi:MAG: beta-galactosidase [Bacteroidales bacterium]|nr:beta-galactosidase [Bacteroidales bacterium]
MNYGKRICITFLLLSSFVGLFPIWAKNKPDKRILEYPFIFGAQYYRAPTPEPECWETDMKKMAEMGFTDIKFWVQWRWSNRTDGSYYFDDLDKLMQIAEKYNLRVTLNTIFDVAPVWLYEKYPDAKQIANNGKVVEPYIVGHRQIGGHPGPCYNHPGALEKRKEFMRQTIKHFKKYKNLYFWDVWNEPELSFPQRNADLNNLVCYCPLCEKAFKEWLKDKYGTIDSLNTIWGRCYSVWDEVELPRNTEAVKDFIDWREFHNYTMGNEAKWRLDMVHELDPQHVGYLHVVPNTMQPFNAVSTCMDDFEVAEHCDVFAATMNNGPFFTPQVISAANGKICYNVESHINGGSITTHQAILELPDLLNDFIPQIGLGIKGFLFWQYRPEVLGIESPAWGLTGLDGSDRPITKATRTFWKTISPYKQELIEAFPQKAEVAIWKSMKNEIFHYSIFKNLESLANSVNAYSEYLYNNSYNYRFVNSEMLDDLQDIKILIMPSCYYLTEKEAEAIDKWVRNGGVLLNEAHLGAYNDNTGRHNRTMPGFGLAEKWGIKEVNTSSPYRLNVDGSKTLDIDVPEDTKKLLRDFGISGGMYVPVIMNDGSLLWGALRYAELEAKDATPLGYFRPGTTCIIKKKIGKGTVYYCGTNIGEGSMKDKPAFYSFLNDLMSDGKVNKPLGLKNNKISVGTLYNKKEELSFITIRNTGANAETLTLDFDGQAKGLFSSMNIKSERPFTLPTNFCDLFVVERK